MFHPARWAEIPQVPVRRDTFVPAVIFILVDVRRMNDQRASMMCYKVKFADEPIVS